MLCIITILEYSQQDILAGNRKSEKTGDLSTIQSSDSATLVEHPDLAHHPPVPLQSLALDGCLQVRFSGQTVGTKNGVTDGFEKILVRWFRLPQESHSESAIHPGPASAPDSSPLAREVCKGLRVQPMLAVFCLWLQRLTILDMQCWGHF